MSLLAIISDKVVQAFAKAGYPDAECLVRASDRPELSDFQSNGALPLAKQTHTNPREIATQIADILKQDDFFATVSVDGPGFINMKISDVELGKLAPQLINTDKCGYECSTPQKTVILDYCGPNIGKVLHFGHLRSSNIGDAVRRIMTFAGDKTIGDAHLGDWGRPMGLVLTELKERWPEMPYFKSDYKNDKGYQVPFTLADVTEVYPIASAKAKENPEYMEQAKIFTRELQAGKKGLHDLWKKFVDMTLADTKELMQILNVHLDLWWGESTVNDTTTTLIQDLQDKGFAVMDDGALVIKQEGDTPPAILVNSAGATMYAASDLATLQERMQQFHPDVVLYFTDARQGLHFSQVFASAKKTGIVPENVSLEFQPFGTVNGPDNKPYKTREGGVPTLRSVIEMAIDTARKKIDAGEMGKDLSEQEKIDISKTVGVAALKFADLMNDKTKNYIFDAERMISTEGKTGPYLLYAIVRMKAILEKVGKANMDKALVITDPAERKLILRLLAFPTAVQAAYDTRAPHIIADYLYNVAGDFNLFYHDCPIKMASATERNSRLALTELSLRIATTCADLLGLRIPDKM
ncbi:MAG: arginine--tRNA ligase [Alphaproteobacteria bacterium]|nr:arginine--tRNA ligase [Alphaproteobacteria bacterium]